MGVKCGMPNALQQMVESDLRQLIGSHIVLVRTALGKRQMDWVRQYPEHMSSAGMLANWETGRSLVNPLFLIRLCEDHGLSMDWFYRGHISNVSESMARLLRERHRSL
jgi:hypothetical protein